MAWYRNTVEYAKENEMLIASMAFYNKYWRKRRQVEHKQVTWDGRVLRCRISTATPLEGFSQILPARYQGLELKEILVSGKRLASESRQLHGREYQMVEMDLIQAETTLEAVYGPC